MHSLPPHQNPHGATLFSFSVSVVIHMDDISSSVLYILGFVVYHTHEHFVLLLGTGGNFRRVKVKME